MSFPMIHKKLSFQNRVITSLTLLLLCIPFTVQGISEQTVEITVQTGDTLIHICEKYLAEPWKWREIAKINNIENPDLIYPGSILLIPARLLKSVASEGVISFLKGDVRYRSGESDRWKPLRLNDRVQEGYGVRTGEESGVEIIFTDGNSILLRPNTVIGISSSRQHRDNHTTYRFLQETGRTITKIRRTTGSESRFRIDTPSAICAARGTQFRTSIDAMDSTRTEVVEGTVNVEAMKKQVAVQKGEGTLVKKGETPLEPQKLLAPPEPKNLLPHYNSIPVSIDFEQMEGPVAYRVLFARDNDFKDIVKESVMAPQDTFNVSVFEDGLYFLQCRSIDTIGLEGLPSRTATIKVRMNPLPPAIVSPADDGRYSDNIPLFNWLKVQDAVRYHLQIADNPTFARVVADEPALKETHYEPGQFDPGTYYFRIRSVADDGYEGQWSDVLSFTVIPKE